MGADFKSASIWMKLAFIFAILAFGLHLWSMDTSGWANNACGYGTNYGSVCRFYIGVEFCEVVGWLCILTAVVLVLCYVLLDELNGNKIALICFIVFSLVAAVLMIIGVIIYEVQRHVSAPYASMLCVMAAICAILAGIFGILEVVGVAPKK